MFQFRQVAGAICTVLAAKQITNLNRFISAKEDYKWDFNWDHRAVDENATDEDKEKYQ